MLKTQNFTNHRESKKKYRNQVLESRGVIFRKSVIQQGFTVLRACAYTSFQSQGGFSPSRDKSNSLIAKKNFANKNDKAKGSLYVKVLVKKKKFFYFVFNKL
jgi:hypothetical protein